MERREFIGGSAAVGLFAFSSIAKPASSLYNSTAVPICDHWDLHEKRPRPPAPYLLQGIRHPSTAGIQTIRDRIRELSIRAGGSTL